MRKVSIISGVIVAIGFLYVGVTGGDHVISRTSQGLMLLSVSLFLLGLVACFSPTVHSRTWLSILSVLGGGYFLWRAGSAGPIGLALPDMVLVLVLLAVYQAIALSGMGLKKIFIVALAILCLANVGVAIAQKFSETSFSVWQGKEEMGSMVTGFFGHYNGMASFMNGAVFFFLSLAVLGRSPYTKIACGILVAGILAALLASGSRGGWVSFVAGGVVWLAAINLWLKQKESKWVGVSLLASFVLAVGGILSSVWVVQNLSEKRVKQDSELANQKEVFVDDGGRLDFQQMAIDVFQDKPILGHGPRAFSYTSLQKWDPSELSLYNRPPEWVHNEYLQALVDYGAVGLVIILVILILHGISGCYSVLIERNQELDNILKIGALGGLAAILCQCFFSFLLHFPSCAVLVALQLGILASVTFEKGHGEVSRGIGSRCLGILGIAVSVSLGAIAKPYYQAYSLAMRANEDLGNAVSVEDQLEALDLYQRAGEAGRDPKILEASGRMAMEFAFDAAKSKQSDIAQSFNLRAKAAFESALKFNPHFPPALAGLPRVYEALGEFEKADEAHEQAMVAIWSREFLLKPIYYASKSSLMDGYRAMAKGDDGLALLHFRKARERYLRRREVLTGFWVRPFEKELSKEIEDWISFHEARLLFKEGDRIWKNARPRNPDLAYALMLEAEKRYQASEETVAPKDRRWALQLKQLRNNLGVFRAGRQTPAKISEEQIQSVTRPEAVLDSEPSKR